MPLSTCQFLIFAAFASAIAFGGCAQQPNQPQEGTNSAVLHYPETRRVEQTDDYHGVKVADPYRWLEGDVRESPEVAEWVAKQNEIARAYLDAIPQRPQIMRRLTEIWNYERSRRRNNRAASISICATTACRIRRCCLWRISTMPTATC